MIDFKEDEKLSVLNHSCAHVMAQAIKHLYPQAKFWVGPVVSEGFYYDVDLGNDVIKDEDIPKIEKEMKKICKDGKRIVRQEISKDEALEMFKDDEYKIDLINNFEDGTNISCYKQGDFVDLCRGPHVETVKACKNFKLTKHSGAYWKGDKNNKVLQRIYGVCFETPEALEEHLNLLEEAKRRDHKKIVVIDGVIGFSGGFNLADEYINKVERFGYWKDSGIMLQGQAVWSLTMMFLASWNATLNTTEDYHRYFPQQSGFNQRDGLVVAYTDSPLDSEQVGEIVYLNMNLKVKTDL